MKTIHTYGDAAETFEDMLIDEHCDLLDGVRALFAANNIDEDRAARDTLREIVRNADARSGRSLWGGTV